MPSLLKAWVQSKLGETITCEEANQLVFHLFLSVACLPDNLLSRVWDRASLAGEFIALAREGVIVGAETRHEEADYWNSIITQLLTDRSRFDSKFFNRVYEAPKS